jgi:hypothetical protein
MISRCELFTVDQYTCFRISDLIALAQKAGKKMAHSTVYKRIKEAGFVRIEVEGETGIWGRIEEK